MYGKMTTLTVNILCFDPPTNPDSQPSAEFHEVDFGTEWYDVLESDVRGDSKL